MEWRALTVAAMDEVAAAFRALVGKTEEELPLVKVSRPRGRGWGGGGACLVCAPTPPPAHRRTRLPARQILEAGTWKAGRVAAKERRPDSSPPINIVSDGTVF